MLNNDPMIGWLMEGDLAIRWNALRSASIEVVE
jgi:hypothetical protein